MNSIKTQWQEWQSMNSAEANEINKRFCNMAIYDFSKARNWLIKTVSEKIGVKKYEVSAVMR